MFACDFVSLIALGICCALQSISVLFVLCISSEFADRYNTALVCHRWRYLACHPRLWLRVDRFVKDLSQPGVFHNIESAVSAARFVMLSYFTFHFFGFRRRAHKYLTKLSPLDPEIPF